MLEIFRLFEMPCNCYPVSRNKFHETFQAINDHFINLGISNSARFEHEARAYTLQIGQDVQYHIENLREAIQRWMMMELLEREMRRPNPLSMSSLTISSTIPIQLHQHMQTQQPY